MALASLDNPRFGWAELSSIGGFLSLHDLAHFSATCRRWRRLLDYPCMRQVVQDRLQKEWWVPCSLAQLQQGFQAIRKKVDVSLRFPYQFTTFAQSFLRPGIHSCHLGDRRWISLDTSGWMTYWKKNQSIPICSIEIIPLQNAHSICLLGSDRWVVITQQNTYLVNLALKNISEMAMQPNYSVFRWSEDLVAFARFNESTQTKLRFCSIKDKTYQFTKDFISSEKIINQVIPCSEESGILCTSQEVGVFRLGESHSYTRLHSSKQNTFWTILPLNKEKIVFRNGLEAMVQIWNIEQCKKERDVVYDSQLQMTKLPNASFLLYAHNQQEALVIDPLMSKPIHAFTSPQKGFTGAVWTQNGPYIVTSYDKHIHFWDLRRHQIIQSMTLPKCMCVVDSMASGDVFLRDPFNRFVALLSPPVTLKK